MHQLYERLSKAVDGASLAVLRICLGLVMCLEAWSLTQPSGSISTGATPLQTYFTGTDVTFNFPYTVVGWLPLFSPAVIHALVGLLAVAGLTFALGFCYRASAVILFLTWGYFFAAESTRTYWQSYYYTELLFLFLLMWMPAANRYSIDAWLQKQNAQPGTVPFWTIYLLRGQLVIAYFYGGVSKLNLDWLLDAVPVRWFLALPEVTRPYEPYLSAGQLAFFKNILQSVGFAYFVSYSGLLFDLSIGFLLLVRRTRYFALACMFLFHATNHFLIFDDIDWFPLVGFTTALIFLDPDWPTRFGNWLRKPRFSVPAWKWFVGGAIVFPLVGALLGWKARIANHSARSFPLHRAVPLLVLGWLAWQAAMPLRHWLIAGDGRFTYEGQSFSWRLKAETRLAAAHQLRVHDPAILAANASGEVHVNWTNWKGEPAIYRLVNPGTKPVPWATLPEFLRVMEPILGERIIYNPFARNVADEAAARRRIAEVWQERYGRAPQFVGRSRPVAGVLRTVSNALRESGHAEEANLLAELASLAEKIAPSDWNSAEPVRNRINSTLLRLHTRDAGGAITPLLRALDPFILQGERRQDLPVLIIEDLPLFQSGHPKRYRVDHALWKSPADHTVTCISPPGPEARDLLPQACIFQPDDATAPYIWWNSARDLSWSKYQHSSYQAFYLRRYARRVAGLWEGEYGRRPAVTAWTSVSLNGRPPQRLVNPEADLASVALNWWGHNDWIYDLQTRRIPREALGRGTDFVHRSGQ